MQINSNMKIKKRKNNIAYIGLFVLALSCFYCNNVFALNFQIDKAKIMVELPPGWSDGGTIEVENKGDDPISVRVYVADWQYSEADGSKNFLPANTAENSCANWIKFYPADFTVPSKEKQTINYVIEIPNNASGGYYAVLFFEVQTGVSWDQTSQTYVKVYNRLGTLFYVEPEGSVRKEAQVSNLGIEELTGVVKATVNFNNTGNVQVVAKGSFDIIDNKGIVLARGDFGEVYAMPGDNFVVSATGYASVFEPGTYDVIVTFDLGKAVEVGEWKMAVNSAGEITGVQANIQ